MDLALMLVLAASALGIGLRAVAWGDRGGPDSPGSGPPGRSFGTVALGLMLGLGALALGVLGLGELGWLSAESLAALLLAGMAVGPWVPAIKRIRQARPQLAGFASGAWVPVGFVLLLAGSTLAASLAPVTDGDALCYHLEVAKRFLSAGTVGFDPDLHETVYPLVKEMLDTFGLSFGSPASSRLVSWLTGVGLGLTVASLARPVLGRAGTAWAVAAALSVPAISNGMSAPLNDVALASFCAAGLLAWIRWLESPTVGRAVLAGAACGLSLGVKYPAIVWVGCLAAAQMAVAWQDVRRQGRRRTLGQLGLFLFIVMAVGMPWYARAWFWTGNPVYPFFRATFGGAGIDEVLDPIKRPLAVTPWNLATALAPMTLEPDRFDSFSHQFGPLFLMFLPGVLLLKAPGRVKGLAAIGFVFLTACLTRRQSMRFVLAVVGPWAVAAAWVAVRGMGDPRSVARRLVWAGFVGVVAFQAAIAVGRTRLAWPVLSGKETVEGYLARREPTAVVGRWMEANLPAGACVIGQDHRGFYFTRPYTMELAHRRRTGLGTRGESADEVVATLRRRGFTHLLMCPPTPVDAVEFDGRLGELLGNWLRSRRPVYRRDLADGDGVERRYAVYDLSPETDRLATSGEVRR